MEALIIRPGALGDTLMALPSLVDVQGKVAVSFVGRRPGLEFIRPHVHRVSDLDGAGWHRLFKEFPDAQSLPISASHCVVGFFGDPDGRIQANLTAYFPDIPVHVFPFLPRKTEHDHVALFIAACLNRAGIPVDPKRALDRAAASALMDISNPGECRQRVVFHPGSGDRKKNYPLDLWMGLLSRFGREDPFQDLQPLVLLGPAEEGIFKRFQEQGTAPPFEVVFCPGKASLTRILRETALYLGHDSGITHLAAMMGVPTIAMFKTTDRRQWHPLGPRVEVVGAQASRPALTKEVMRAGRSLLHP